MDGWEPVAADDAEVVDCNRFDACAACATFHPGSGLGSLLIALAPASVPESGHDQTPTRPRDLDDIRIGRETLCGHRVARNSFDAVRGSRGSRRGNRRRTRRTKRATEECHRVRVNRPRIQQVEPRQLFPSCAAVTERSPVVGLCRRRVCVHGPVGKDTDIHSGSSHRGAASVPVAGAGRPCSGSRELARRRKSAHRQETRADRVL